MQFDCSSCQLTLEVVPTDVGQDVICPRCKSLVQTAPVPLRPTRKSDEEPANYFPYILTGLGIGVATGLLLLILIAIAYRVATRRSGPDTAHETASPANDKPSSARPVASGESRKKDGPTKAEREEFDRMLARAADVAYVSSVDLEREFSVNALAAEKKYDGRIMEVTGVIGFIGKNNEGLPLLVFQSASQKWLVRAFINKSGADSFSSARVGDPIMVTAWFSAMQGTVIELAGADLATKSSRNK